MAREFIENSINVSESYLNKLQNSNDSIYDLRRYILALCAVDCMQFQTSGIYSGIINVPELADFCDRQGALNKIRGAIQGGAFILALKYVDLFIEHFCN